MFINIKNIWKKPIPGLIRKNQYSYRLANLLIQYIRTTLNKIKWEDNRQFSAIEQRQSRVPKNTEEANKLFIATEQGLSLSEKARMERIDEILGTNTHFHDTKIYQERLDSDHIMDLQQLKREHKEKSRKTLNWENPKAYVKIRYKNKKKYYDFISTLRTYPQHQPKKYDFSDESNEHTIQFLAKETVYSKISLKPVELAMQSMENEVISYTAERPFESQKFYYFRPQFTMQLFRIQKSFFREQMLHDEKVFNGLQQNIQQIISLDEIYEILKQYDEDERVNEYLKKIQNNRIQYLLSYFTYDSSQNVMAIMIDLLGNQKQYCLILKSLNLFKDKTYKHRVIFNTRPKIAFTHDGRSICYIQRSQEGGWIELVYRAVDTFWFKQQAELIVAGQEDGGQQIMYRCSPEKQLILGTDSNKNYIFLTIREYNKAYSEHLFILHFQDQQQNDKKIELIQLDKGQKVKYYYDVSPLGIVYAKFSQVTSYLKFAQNSKESREIFLIPLKEHLLIQQDEKIGISSTFLTGKVQTKYVHPPTEFDVSKKRVILKTKQNEYIKEIQTRLTHLILVLNIYSIYDKAILYFLPFKANSHPHSIIFGGGAQIRLRGNTYGYQSQTIEFMKEQGCLSIEKSYNIWKKELTDLGQDLYKYHFEKITINKEGEYPIQISLLCKSLYMDEKNLPILLYIPTRHEKMEESCLRKFLEKGVMIVEFLGRGTFSKDLQHFMSGSQDNFETLFDDLQEVIEFIGNNLTKNISLYCKGEISSLVGLWFNVYFPFLFNTTVLHNGAYDLQDRISLKRLDYFFGNMDSQDVLLQESRQRMLKRLNRFNILKHNFRRPYLTTQTSGEKKLQIGSLENLIISSDKDNRIHSRKLIHRLRQNSQLKYEQVYLKEYQNEYEIDLVNLSYIYSHIRTRLETQINTPREQFEEDSEEKTQL